MEVVPVVADSGVRAYLVPCPKTRHVVIIGALPELKGALQEALEAGNYRRVLELQSEPGVRVPLLGDAICTPRLEGGELVVRSPAGDVQVPMPDPEATHNPDDPMDKPVCRVGSLEIRALPVTRSPVEVAWRIGSALFTSRVLFGPGVWPAAATPVSAMALPSEVAIYPRHASSGHPVSTVALERAWYDRWRKRGYDPTIPDPTATIPSAPMRKAE